MKFNPRNINLALYLKQTYLFIHVLGVHGELESQTG